MILAVQNVITILSRIPGISTVLIRTTMVSSYCYDESSSKTNAMYPAPVQNPKTSCQAALHLIMRWPQHVEKDLDTARLHGSRMQVPYERNDISEVCSIAALFSRAGLILQRRTKIVAHNRKLAGIRVVGLGFLPVLNPCPNV